MNKLLCPDRLLVPLLSISLLCLVILVPLAGQEPSPDAVIGRFQASLAAKDLPAYLQLFVPELQEQEKNFYEDMFDRFRMDKVLLRRVGSASPVNPSAPLYIQAFFENSYSAIQEIWQVSLVRVQDQYFVAEKKYAGDITTLYKITIPNERVERAARVEVSHQDIRLTFTDALVFYDNLPDLKTALLVIGRGRVHFMPSISSEQHQLEMSYGKTSLDQGLEYAYLRFSPGFFKDNIRVEKEAAERPRPASAADLKRAYSIFSKLYPRSYTVENPLNGAIYSTLPQSDEAVFDFQTESGQEFTYINSPFVPESIHLIDQSQDRLVNLYSPPEEPGQKRMVLSIGPRYDVVNYNLDVDFTPENKNFSVKARLDLKAKTDRLDTLKLVLNPALEIVHLRDGAGRELFYTQDRFRNLLYIYLISPVARDASFTLELFYRGRLEPSEATLDVLDAPPAQQAYSLVPITFDSYFYTHSARWYPAPQEEDYFTARVRLIIPPDYQCVANGRLLGQSRFNDVQNVEAIEKVGRSVFTFATQSEVKYLSFVVARMYKDQEASSGIPGALYVTPSIYVRPRGIWDMCRDILTYYQKLFGGYPFEKLDVVERLWPRGGGNSPASFIILNEIPHPQDTRVILNPDSPVDFSRWKEYFPAHEIAHQWWGQGVSWNTYHDQWLSEGLAQLSSFLYLEQKYGDKALLTIQKRLCQWTKKLSIWGAISLGSRLSHLNFAAFQGLIYDKSALVALMLREMLGVGVFEAGLKGFFQTCRYTAARTSQFEKAMETASGRDLSLFFKSWFDSYRLPQVRWTWTAEKKDEGYVLRLSFEQTKDVFVFPLVVQWREAGQTVRRTVVVDKKDQVVELTLKSKPEKLQADPDQVFPGALTLSR